jgi:hypothetical protein
MAESEKDISLKGVRLPNSIRQQIRQTRKKLTEGKSPPLIKKKIKPIGLKQITTEIIQQPPIHSKKGILAKGVKKNKTFKRVRFSVGADAQNDKETPIMEGVFVEPPRLRLKNKSGKINKRFKTVKNNSTRKTFKIRIVNVDTKEGDIDTKEEDVELDIHPIQDALVSPVSPILKDRGSIYALKGTPDGLIRSLNTLTEDVEVYKN